MLGERVEPLVNAEPAPAGRRQSAHEGAAADARGDEAELGQAAVHARGGEVVHADQLGELARGRSFSPGSSSPASIAAEAVDDLLRQGGCPIALEIRQVDLVRH